MKKFTFKLEAVLEQRKLAERLRQREVASAQHKLLTVQAEVDALGAVNRSSAVELRAGGRLTAMMLAAHQRFALAARQRVATLNRQMAAARGEMDHAQTQLLEAAKQRKVMEKLRERDLARWLAAQRKHDLAEAAEAAQQMHGADAADGASARARGHPSLRA
ncbi:MAG: flagellar FliJ family protein [Tepidisphaeraceae bacterium]